MFGDENWLLTRLLILIPLFISLGVHEWAHAWMATRLGDDTAKCLGRLTLNPLAHVDPIGTFVLPLLGVPFGWAKPVPFNPTRFRGSVNMTTGTMLTALAGPVSNVILAAVCVALLFSFRKLGFPTQTHQPLGFLLESLIMLNVVLAVFNLIPIPPLDGSHIINAFLPRALQPAWAQLTSYGFLPIIAFLFLIRPLTGLDPVGWAVGIAAQLIHLTQ